MVQLTAGSAPATFSGQIDSIADAVRVADDVYQARATANAQMVVTSEGNVLIDTGLPIHGFLADYLKEVSSAPVTHLIATHAHADHYAATSSFADDDTETIVHAEFPHNQRYLKALAPTLMRRNKIFFPDDVPPVPTFALAALYPTIEPTRLVQIAEASHAVRERPDDFVVIRLELVCATEVAFRTDGVVERDVHEVAEVVMVPRRLWREARCFSVRTNRHAVVAEQRMAEPGQCMEHVVVRAVREHAPQMERRLPRVVLEVQLREVTVCEERCIASVLSHGQELRQQTLRTL